MALPAMEQAGLKTAALLAYSRENKMPIIHVQHINEDAAASFFARGTNGAEINSCAIPLPGEAVIIKRFPNSFRGTDLAQSLEREQVKELVICGAMSNMCIDATTRAASDLGFHCTVVQDACAARPAVLGSIQVPAEQVHAAFMANLGSAYATVLSLEELLQQRRGSA